MVSPIGNRRLRRPSDHFKRAQWLLYWVCSAIVIFSLLSWDTFGALPVLASGARLRDFGRSARTQVGAFLQRLRRRSPQQRQSSSAQQRLNRRSKSLHDISGEFVEESPQMPASEEGASAAEGGATAAVSCDSSGQKEVAVKSKLLLRGMHVEPSPLHKLIPEKEALIFRYKREPQIHDFHELRQRRYLGAASQSLWYLVADGRKKYLLRLPCAPMSKGAPSTQTEQLTKVIKYKVDASVALTKRLSGESTTSELVAKGLGVPLNSGTLLGIPEIFVAEGMVCGKQGILYPAMQYTLLNLLKNVQLSDSARMYLTRAAVLSVAEMHNKFVTLESLSMNSFRLDGEGKLYIIFEFDTTYGGGWGKGETPDEQAPGDAGAAAGPSTSEGATSGARRHSSTGRKESITSSPGWAVSEKQLTQLPGTSTEGTIVHGSSAAALTGSQGSLRPKRRSPQKEARLLFSQRRDAFQLGHVIYGIWCGIDTEDPESHVGTSYTLTRMQKTLSFKDCQGNPPQEVKSLIRKLQSTRHSSSALPSGLIATSPLFQEYSPRDSSSSTST